MSNDQTEYELFISYARLDNRPIPVSFPHGWVSALKEQILADHRRYETSPLRIFFDTHEIRDMDDWKNRILGSLRRSKVLLICLSPNYFASKPCRWEWDEYQARQHQKLIGSDSHATVYFVEVPGADEQEMARRLDAIMGKNFTDLRPWFNAGAAAMREYAVRQRMAALGQSVWERIDRSRRALSVPGNVRGMTPHFVGRNEELADLHRLVGVGKIGLVTAVHGLGGQGKTELAVAYARGHADCYPLGLWSLEAESRESILPLIGNLAFDPRFGYSPSEAEKADAEKLGLGVLVELGRRAEAARAQNPDVAPAALLILDNVSRPGLLAATELSKIPEVDWLRIVATTRLDPNAIDPARKRLGAVEVDSLDPENALRLIVDHLPPGKFWSARDEADAREIVRELGGFTLAVEQVAVFLGLYSDTTTPGQYLAHLRANGLSSTDDLVDDDAKKKIEHQTKLLRPILESMLAPLGAAGRTLLTFAALLPPERIPWPWLRELAGRHHPELLDDTLPNDWTRLRRQVQGLRFLTGSTEDQSARMHRLIAAHLRANGDEALDAELRSYLARRADDIYQQQAAPADWELDGLLEAIPHLLKGRLDQQLAVDGMFLSDKVAAYRNLSLARSLLKSTGAVIQTLVDEDPDSAEKRRDLSVSFNRLGDVSVAAGDLAAARGYFERGLKIAERLADEDPESAQKRRDLSISFERLGDVSVAAGDLAAARGYFDRGLKLRERLADEDPDSAEKRRDLSISFNKLGDVSVAAGDLAAARGYFDRGLKLRERLADEDPESAEKRRDLSVSFNRLGDVSVEAGDLAAARGYFERGLKIAERLADEDPDSAEKRRDLSISFNKLGDVSVAAGDLAAARGYFDRGLKLRERLADEDPESAQKRRDLSISFERLGDVSVAAGDLAAARGYFERGLKIAERLADEDPDSAEKRRDLSISFNKLGDVSVAAGDLAAARGYFDRGLKLRERLAAEDPDSAEKRRDLSISFNKLGDVSVEAGDLAAARGYFDRGLKLRERLADEDPESAQKRRDLSISFERLGDVSVAAGDLAAARGYFERGLKIAERLADEDPDSAQKRRDMFVSHAKIASLLEREGDPTAIDHWREAHDILDGLRRSGKHLSPGDLGNLRWLKEKLGLGDEETEG